VSITKLSPYLNFNGNAGAAIQHYEGALGAKTELLQRFADIPGGQVAEADKQRVMHARVRIGGDLVLVSDTQPGMPFSAEGNMHVCLELDDLNDAKAKFDALAAGGTITMPLQDTFWGATFGTVTDAYGVRWMFNINK
jgi:PhnB protein